MYAKAFLARPESADTANIVTTRANSAATKNKTNVKSNVLKTFDKSLLPQLNSTQGTARPESAFNMSLRPESAAYYSKIDILRPESAMNFRKLRPGSAINYNSKVCRPFSAIIRPESAFIKEANEDDSELKL